MEIGSPHVVDICFRADIAMRAVGDGGREDQFCALKYKIKIVNIVENWIILLRNNNRFI